MTMHIAPSYVSPELEQAAASTRTEMQARTDRAHRAQDAFLTVVKTASEMTTERMMFLARSEALSLSQRDHIGLAEFDAKLIAECTRLTRGDELKARILASAVLFG